MNPFGIIHAQRAGFPIRVLCELLGVSRAGYYAWRDRKPSARARSEERIVTKMAAIQAQTRYAYGSPRMLDDLRQDGEHIGKGRVAALMRKHGLNAVQKKRFVRTTDSAHDAPIASNVLQRDFTADAPNRVWVGDITYLRPKDGFAYRAVLHEHGVVQSMSRAGDCYDNAVAESFFAGFKKECVRGATFDSFNHARRVVEQYIDAFCNPRRRHSNNRSISPLDFEALHAKQHQARNAAWSPLNTVHFFQGIPLWSFRIKFTLDFAERKG